MLHSDTQQREKEKQIFFMKELENDYFATCDVTINSGNGCKMQGDSIFRWTQVPLHEDLLTIKGGTADI